MKVDTTVNRVALAEEETTNAAARVRIGEYLSRTGLSHPDFARRIGYSHITLRMFLSGSYHNISRSARNLVAAAEAYMDSHPIGPVTQVGGEIYDTGNVRAIRNTFGELSPQPVACMLYGPPGSQKSFVLKAEIARLNREQLAKDESGSRAYYVYTREGIRPRDLMRRVCIACGCRTNNDIDPMIAGLRHDFTGRRVLLVLDEAQHLSIECFETLRELLDEPPHFSLLFAGSHDLKRKFDEFSATREQWNSRIIAKVLLPGLERDEARGIIEREIGLLLSRRTAAAAGRLIDELIAGATTRDAFVGNRNYINVRTLTNALDQIKLAARNHVEQNPAMEAIA